jgi:tetratricopeptide (TPR) repeat protein
MNVPVLEVEELLHLALEALRQREHDKAISLLKRGLEAAPRDARLLYLLGAEHAQIGLYHRAIDEISRSIDIDPNVPSARFQLGLLRLFRGEGAAALAAWESLSRLSEDDPLRVCAQGLSHLIGNDSSACTEHLRRGITLAAGNPGLAESMQRILDTIVAKASNSPEPAAAAEVSGQHVLLSGYTGG